MESANMLKQLLEKFHSDEAIIAEERSLITEQITQLESRLEACLKRQGTITADREKVAAMMDRYVNGVFTPAPEIQARIDSGELTISAPQRPAKAAKETNVDTRAPEPVKTEAPKPEPVKTKADVPRVEVKSKPEPAPPKAEPPAPEPAVPRESVSSAPAADAPRPSGIQAVPAKRKPKADTPAPEPAPPPAAPEPEPEPEPAPPVEPEAPAYEEPAYQEPAAEEIGTLDDLAAQSSDTGVWNQEESWQYAEAEAQAQEDVSQAQTYDENQQQVQDQTAQDQTGQDQTGQDQTQSQEGAVELGEQHEEADSETVKSINDALRSLFKL